MNVSSIDYTIIILYLVGIVGLGIWSGFQETERGRRKPLLFSREYTDVAGYRVGYVCGKYFHSPFSKFGRVGI